LRAIAGRGYVRNRVFFADEDTAIAAGFRPCAVCLPEKYRPYLVNTANWWCRCTTRTAVRQDEPEDDAQR
jgi:methylphosphotriester-DNA--protein-cysteine methyltransferase